MIRITSKQDGFRRCGVAHPAQPTEHPDDKFTKDQLAILQADPMLVVEMTAAAPGAPGKPNRPNATDTIIMVQAAETLEALAELEAGEERKGVLDAIAKRKAELNPAE